MSLDSKGIFLLCFKSTVEAVKIEFFAVTYKCIVEVQISFIIGYINHSCVIFLLEVCANGSVSVLEVKRPLVMNLLHDWVLR
jgi:hypothetical protein